MFARIAFYPTLCYNVVLEKLRLIDWYSRIDDTVVLGALPFMSTAKKLVEEEKVTGVITMNEEFETKVFCPTKEAWEDMGVKQLLLPTMDLLAAPSQDNIQRGVDFILHHRSKGGSVYVHCKAGRTRSATVVAAYLMTLHGITPEVATQEIQSRRSHISIRAPQRAALEEFHKKIRQHRRQ